MAPSSERPHPAECGSQSTIPIAPASKLFSLAVEVTLIEFLKTVLLIEFSVGLRVCKKAERFSTMVSYIQQDALAQHPAAEPLPLLVWLHSQQIQIPSLSAETVAGFHSHNVPSSLAAKKSAGPSLMRTSIASIVRRKRVRRCSFGILLFEIPDELGGVRIADGITDFIELLIRGLE